MGTDKFKILVADDERSNIDALAFILKPMYSVLVAKDGPTAIEIANNKKPDLILLDVIMPGMNGFETLSRLKDSEQTNRIPVIFITGRNSMEDEKKGFALGAVDYIIKPFHDAIVEARVRTHLQIVESIHTIERLCKLDALTNIPNRRFFDAQIIIEWERAARYKTPLSILIIDVDKFKRYNDSFGHPQGDVALKAVATAIKKSLKRPSDFTARIGGEEFAALLPDTKLDGAVEVAQRIRTNIEQTIIPCVNPEGTHITASIGAASDNPSPDRHISELISAADKALYAAKAAGRNSVKTN